MGHKVTIDKSTNRLFIYMAGFFKKADEQELVKDIEDGFKSLGTNITVLVDTRKFNLVENISFFANTLKKYYEFILRSAFIFPDNPLVVEQIKTYMRKSPNVNRKIFSSLTSAERWLNEIEICV